ncbi:MAG: Gfo/Idh/MocA family oxidoreductase [Ruminococcaceae bacterium]|nr:Gfo/Idh/MocA family oxidoreductase [Oscillospiraceae bacterium]
MNKIKIAQIGTSANSHGNFIWESMIKQKDIFDVVGYALPENEREKFPDRAKAFDGYNELTVDEILNNPEIEAVAVETEEIYLIKYALMVANAGKHLHMEKPGGVDLADFEKLVEILKSKNLTFSTGYMYRFNPKIQEALAKVKNGELGEIYSVEAHMDCKHPAEVRQWLQNFPGGMMFFLGCHLIDLIYQIQGEPEEIIPFNCSTGYDEVTANDYGMVVFKYKNGVSFAKTCANENGGFLRRQLVICGEKGTIEIKPLEAFTEGGQYTVMNEVYSTEWGKEWDTSKSDVYDRYDDMMRNFAEMVRGKENRYSYDYELGLYKLILKSCGKEV